MTAALQKAFDEVAKLPEREQDRLAARLLAELAAEDAFDRAAASRTPRRQIGCNYSGVLDCILS